MGESENTNKSPEELWQQSEDERLEYEGYCRKIIQGLENQDEKSGIRAIWELVQNARDLSDNANIKIELTGQSFIFSHHGRPFDYTSFRALVKQDSSKDRANANIVGQYGTGFMTTHTFNRLVYVSAPFAVKRGQDEICGYVQVKDFALDRTKVDTADGPRMMKEQLGSVKNFWKKPQSPTPLDDITSFRYDLKPEQVADVSGYIDSAIRLMPFVLVLNDSIKCVEIVDRYRNKWFTFRKCGEKTIFAIDKTRWIGNDETIEIRNIQSGTVDSCHCRSLKSEDGDVVIIPPYPSVCGRMEDVPSLFLWFPLLGTEKFGVNFIFHSKRFYPVEKRNNIMIPGVSEISKVKGGDNEEILKGMMDALFAYYTQTENAKNLGLKMCEVAFPCLAENEETQRFYKEMQSLWVKEMPKWKVVPVGDERMSVDDERLMLLHPDFYNKLTPELCKQYEPVMAQYAMMVKGANGEAVSLPNTDLIEWSRIVDRWGCNRNPEFFVNVIDVCKAINDKGENLHEFLMFLKDSGNDKLMDEYPLLPNREGYLRLRNGLYYGEFMTDNVYRLVKNVMGDDKVKMYDPTYTDVSAVNPYKESDLQKAIANNIQQWRNQTLNRSVPGVLDDDQLNALIDFCLATCLPDFRNQRGRMMPILAEYYEKDFEVIPTIKFREDEEEEFYKPAFNFLLDYTLAQVCKQDASWVATHKDWLLRFLTEYAPKENEERRKKLDSYGVLPNMKNGLCLKSELKANRNVPEKMVEIYLVVFGKDLKEEWIDEAFDGIVDLPPVLPSDVAEDIEKALVADMKQDGEHKFEKVVRQIILMIGESKEWEEWFGQINDKKAVYTFSMKTGDAQKHLFSLMDNLDDDHLKRLAMLGENGSMDNLIEKLESLQQQECDKTARFEHLHKIGKHIEEVLLDRIGRECIDIEMPEKKEDVLKVGDIQDGQDIIVKACVNGVWRNIYYIEVKSKWDFNEPAHMSTNQVKMASQHPSEYALCCVDLRKYKNENLAALPEDVIIKCTHVKTDIGKQLGLLVSDILDADGKSDEVQIKISDYRSNMSAGVFEEGEPFEGLLEDIEARVKQYLSSGC